MYNIHILSSRGYNDKVGQSRKFYQQGPCDRKLGVFWFQLRDSWTLGPDPSPRIPHRCSVLKRWVASTPDTLWIQIIVSTHIGR